MVRALLALWYTLTVLLGPALCCCAVLPASAAPAQARQVADAPNAVEKSCCCPTEAADECPRRSDLPQDGHPDGCPCKKFEKQDQDRPVWAVSGGAEIGWQSRSLDLLSLVPSVGHSASPGGLDGGGVDSQGVSAGLAGRDLLTAYHILRC